VWASAYQQKKGHYMEKNHYYARPHWSGSGDWEVVYFYVTSNIVTDHTCYDTQEEAELQARLNNVAIHAYG
jgi:hypothetical protein